jgi:hypothetical protein
LAIGQKVKGPNELIRDALKREFYPRLIGSGYSGKHPNFQKKVDGVLHLVTVCFTWQFQRFTIEVAKFPAGDITDPSIYGKVIPEAKIDATFATKSRVRLGTPRSDCYSYSACGLDVEKFDALAKEIAANFYQAEEWLESGVVGDGIACILL